MQVYTCVNNSFDIYCQTCFSHDAKITSNKNFVTLPQIRSQKDLNLKKKILSKILTKPPCFPGKLHFRPLNEFPALIASLAEKDPFSLDLFFVLFFVFAFFCFCFCFCSCMYTTMYPCAPCSVLKYCSSKSLHILSSQHSWLMIWNF